MYTNDVARPIILAVDRNLKNLELLENFVGREGFEVRTASTLEDLDRHLQSIDEVALALLDLSGFEKSVWDRCRALAEHGIPFFVLSIRKTPALERETTAQGAAGLLVKPLVIRELIELIRDSIQKDAA